MPSVFQWLWLVIKYINALRENNNLEILKFASILEVLLVVADIRNAFGEEVSDKSNREENVKV